MNNNVKVCTKCVLNSSFPGISFDNNGVCSRCRDYEQRYASFKKQKEELPQKRIILDQLCRDAKNKKKQFDALVPLSGGKDSMYVLYIAVKELGLKVLAFTMDNGYLTEYARGNIDRACKILGVEHIYYRMDPSLMRCLFRLSIEKTGYFCSVCMRAIEMTTARIADMYDIPLVFGGSASKVELPVASEMFQPGEVNFFKNVFKGESLPSGYERLLYKGSIKRRIGYHLFWWGSQRRVWICAWVNLPTYIDWDYNTMYRTIREELGWQSPTGKDEEHIDCAVHKASAYIHDRRWKNSEKDRLTLAGLIMAGQLKRDEALTRIKKSYLSEYKDEDLSLLLNDINMTKTEFDNLIDMGPRYVNYRHKRGNLWRSAARIKRMLFSFINVNRYK